ncbi:MAG: transketolase C-terminal domain-containing protein [Microgenomates group bacterium]
MSTSQKKVSAGSTRDGFGDGLVEAAKENEQIVGLCADLTESTRMLQFSEMFPERFVQVGVAEENMVGLAAGMALSGKIPFVSSYAAFSPANSWGPIRSTVCYSRLNVKFHGGHSGLSTGPDGATHQALEDIALMRVLPHMTVVVPADKVQAFEATKAIAKELGPCYIRTSKFEVTEVTSGHNFKLGKAQVLSKGKDVTIVACGIMVERAVEAAEKMSGEISATVINMHTIKPLDVKTLMTHVSKTQAIVVAEDHQKAGGLGSAIAEALVLEDVQVFMEFVAVDDSFGESGTPEEVLEKYGLTTDHIITAVEKSISRKKHHNR